MDISSSVADIYPSFPGHQPTSVSLFCVLSSIFPTFDDRTLPNCIIKFVLTCVSLMLLASHRDPIVGTIMVRFISLEDIRYIANDAEIAGIILACYHISVTLLIEALGSHLGKLPRRLHP